MLYAFNSALVRTSAEDANKKEEYYCPICSAKVIPRQGDCNRWHFAHRVSCEDHWSYDMSEWHQAWQAKYPEETRERVIEFSGAKHRADVLLGDVVIEFQHSPITASEFSDRNLFYTRAGYRVLWVFDAVSLYATEQIRGSDENNAKFHWDHPSRVLSHVVPQYSKNVAIVLELANGSDDDAEPWLVKVQWAISSDDGEYADYSIFYIEDNFRISIETQKDVSEVFMNKWERFNAFLRENQPYACKCSKSKGNPRSWYMCEKTNDWHKDTCQECPYNLVTEYRKTTSYRKGGRYYYCRYPDIVTEPDQYGMIQRFTVRL